MMKDDVPVDDEVPPDARRIAIGRVPRQTLAGAVGIARGAGPVPMEEDVKRWIEEERFGKYGERGERR